MRGGKHRWWSRQMPPFKRYFSQANLADTIKLLPWCVSFTVTPHYMSRMMAIAMQQEEDSLLHLSLWGHQLQATQAVQLIHPELHHFQYLPYQICPL